MSLPTTPARNPAQQIPSPGSVPVQPPSVRRPPPANRPPGQRPINGGAIPHQYRDELLSAEVERPRKGQRLLLITIRRPYQPTPSTIQVDPWMLTGNCRDALGRAGVDMAGTFFGSPPVEAQATLTIDEANTALAVARNRHEQLRACEALIAAAQTEAQRLRASSANATGSAA